MYWQHFDVKLTDIGLW